MKTWVVQIVPVIELQAALNALERAHSSDDAPIITYVDQSRVIISWSYLEFSADAAQM